MLPSIYVKAGSSMGRSLASHSARHSSDQVFTGWPVISEMAVVSRE